MKRRPFSPTASLPQGEPFDVDDGGVADPDPTVSFPQWSRSLLLLLDYAIIEGLQHRQLGFVHYLKLAEAELTQAASEGIAKENTGSHDERPLPSKTH
ncbi:MAG: hypothetical protein QNJ62_03325 [Methyloceanibacter sp.]|nr:hypothetical protein [Methyloceanibacter sp.]